VIAAIGEVLRSPRGTADEAAAVRLLCRRVATLADVRGRAAILGLVGDVHEAHPRFAVDVLRFLAHGFAERPIEVKLAALTLAGRLAAVGKVSAMPLFGVRVGARDREFDVRDRPGRSFAWAAAGNSRSGHCLSSPLGNSRDTKHYQNGRTKMRSRLTVYVR
jgi:hypothetical protein